MCVGCLTANTHADQPNRAANWRCTHTNKTPRRIQNVFSVNKECVTKFHSCKVQECTSRCANSTTHRTLHSSACSTCNCWDFIQELLQCLHFVAAAFGMPAGTICCAHGTVPHTVLNYKLSNPISQTCSIKTLYPCAVCSQQALLSSATPTLSPSLTCMQVHAFPSRYFLYSDHPTVELFNIHGTLTGVGRAPEY